MGIYDCVLFQILTALPGVPEKSGTLNFRYFDIGKYSIFLFHQIQWNLFITRSLGP